MGATLASALPDNQVAFVACVFGIHIVETIATVLVFMPVSKLIFAIFPAPSNSADKHEPLIESEMYDDPNVRRV